MSWKQIKALNEQRGAKLGEMKIMLNKAETEKRDLTTEESSAFDKLSTEAETILADVQRRERLYAMETDAAARMNAIGKGEQRAGRDDINTPESQVADRAKETRAQIDRYLRTGELASSETRAITVSGQGIVGDRPFYDGLVLALKSYDGVRLAGANVIPSTNGNPITIGYFDDTAQTGQQVGEATTDNTEADPSGTPITAGAYKYDSKWIKISTELIQDAAYPVEATVLNIAGERIGRILNTKTTTGSGTGTIQGFLTGAGVGATTASTSAVTYEEMLDLVHSVDSAYRNSGRCRFQLNDQTLAAVRKLKDSVGHFIFTPGAVGQPDNLLGFGYVVNNDMPALSAGAASKVMAFGDWSRYVIRDVTTPEIVVARELFAGDGLVGYRVFHRADGKLIDANAVKVLQLHA